MEVNLFFDILLKNAVIKVELLNGTYFFIYDDLILVLYIIN